MTGELADGNRDGGASLIDPLGLVREYVRRDAGGERMGPSPWFGSVVVWPDDPGYDSHTVIRKYEVERPATMGGSPVKIMVRYEVIGWIMSSGFLPQEKNEEFEFVVIRTEEGVWLIQSPQIEQHILPDPAAGVRHLSAEDAARIRELATAPPAEESE
jgi:hypothetical protein